MQPRLTMKFGGTSVGTPQAVDRAVAHVAAARAQSPLVVLSAVGGVTDLLLRAASVARAGDDATSLVLEIGRRHRAIAEHVGLAKEPLATLENELIRLLQGIALLRELTPRIQDEVLSFGERVSVLLFEAALAQRGVAARAHVAWELGMQSDGAHGAAEVSPARYPAIRAAVAALPTDRIPVVTGFLAQSPEGEITTLGRGGSDLSAAIFAAACEVEELQIWTDVPGILRADPRVVSHAEVIPAILFEEAAELAYFGAKVLHPRTIEPARQRSIPVRVLSTFTVEPGGAATAGTLIDQQAAVEEVRALALRRGVESVQIQSSRMLAAPGFLSRVFDVFARHGISVDVVATSEVSLSLTFDQHALGLAGALRELSSLGEVQELPERSILCIVGAGLRHDASLLSRIFATLAEDAVPVHVISQGASRINITVVTDPERAERAMRTLHARFFEGG